MTVERKRVKDHSEHKRAFADSRSLTSLLWPSSDDANASETKQTERYSDFRPHFPSLNLPVAPTCLLLGS